MINLSDVATGLLGLGVIAGAVGLVATGGRDRTADQHTVADYQPEPDPVADELKRRWLAGYERDRHRMSVLVADILPPCPARADVGSPLYVETLFRTWHPDAPDVVAAGMLREIAAEQRPADDENACDVCHGDPAECGHLQDDDEWPDDWATGAFPVVRAA